MRSGPSSVSSRTSVDSTARMMPSARRSPGRYAQSWPVARRRRRRSSPPPRRRPRAGTRARSLLAAQRQAWLGAGTGHRKRRLAPARRPLHDAAVLLGALRRPGRFQGGRRTRERRRVSRPHADAAEESRAGRGGEARVHVGHAREDVAHLDALQGEARGRAAGGGVVPGGGPCRGNDTDGARAGDLDARRLADCPERLVESRTRVTSTLVRPTTFSGTTKPPLPSTASAWKTSAKSTSRKRSVSGPRPGSLAVGARPLITMLLAVSRSTRQGRGSCSNGSSTGAASSASGGRGSCHGPRNGGRRPASP